MEFCRGLNANRPTVHGSPRSARKRYSCRTLSFLAPPQPASGSTSGPYPDSPAPVNQQSIPAGQQPPGPQLNGLPPLKQLAASVQHAAQAWQYQWRRLQLSSWKSVEARLALQVLQLVASLLFVVLYVWDTYSHPARNSLRHMLDTGLAMAFAADYVVRIMSSGVWWRAILNPINIVDFLSFAPSLLEGTGLSAVCHQLKAAGLDLRWFRIFRALRLLRLSLLTGNLPLMKMSRSALLSGAVNVRLLQLVASVLALLFTSASLVHLVERIPWHDALYFVTTTLTTVGYGDVLVKSTVGRIIVLGMMAVGVVLIPVRTSQLYSQLSAIRVSLGSMPQAGRPFVLVSTRLSEVRGFSDLFNQFLNQVQRQSALPQQLQMVCLCNKPSYEFTAFQELHDRRLSLLEGSVLSSSDLVRAQAERASAILLLGDRFTHDSRVEDLDMLFKVWAIKSYTKCVPLSVQVMRTASLPSIQPFLDPVQDCLISVEATRHRLLALSALCPGASTLLGNLLHTSNCSPTLAATALRSSNTAVPQLSGRRWLAEYVRGCGHELFVVKTDAAQEGVKFEDAVLAAFMQEHAIVLGVITCNGMGPLMLNPRGLGLHASDHLLVLACNQEQAQKACAAVKPLGSYVSTYLDATGGNGDQDQSSGAPQCELSSQTWTGSSSQDYSSSTVSSNAVLAHGVAKRAWSSSAHKQDGASHAAANMVVDENHVTKSGDVHASSSHSPTNATSVEQCSVTRAVLNPYKLGHEASRHGSIPASGNDSSALAGSRAVGASGSVSSEFSSTSTISSAGLAGMAAPSPQHQGLHDNSTELQHRQTQQEAQRFDVEHSYSGPSMNSFVADRGMTQFQGSQAPIARHIEANHTTRPHQQPTNRTSSNGSQDLHGSGNLGRNGGPNLSNSRQQSPYTNKATSGQYVEGFPITDHALGLQQPAAPAEAHSVPASEDGGPASSSRTSIAGLPEFASMDSMDAFEAARQKRQAVTKAAPYRADISELQGHIILAGAQESFEEFAAELQRVAGSADGALPLVVLHPSLNESVLLGLAKLGPVWQVKGTPCDAQDLAKANASTARCLVYVGRNERPAPPATDDSDGYGSTTRAAVVADAEALQTCYGVGEGASPHVSSSMPDSVLGAACTMHAVVELAYTSSVRFLQPGLLLQGASNWDSVSCGLAAPRQSWQSLKAAEEAALENGLSEWQVNNYYSAGRVLVPAVLDTFACQAFFKKDMLPEFLTELCGDDGRPRGAMLRQIVIDPEFVSRPYKDLFVHLVASQGLIPLALYRKKRENPTWRMRYVSINPAWEDIVEATDLVFVLRQREEWVVVSKPQHQ